MDKIILLVDDEPDMLEMLGLRLKKAGYKVITAITGEECLQKAEGKSPDLILLDILLPGMSGFEVARRLKAKDTTKNIPVIMVTAKGEEVDRVVGLELGADDYIVKPFSPRELVARVKALLRRPRTLPAMAEAVSSPDQAPGGLAIDVPRRSATVDGRRIALTTTEFQILAVLSRDPGVVVSRQALLDAVWGVDFVGDDHLVDVHVANLRRKLGDDVDAPRFVETVRGAGYRLAEPA